MRRLCVAGLGVALAALIGASGASAATNFFRTAFTGQTSLSTTQEATRYAELVMQSPQASRVAQLHTANPSLKVYMYQSMLESSSSDPSGYTTCTAYSSDNSSHPAWFLKDQYGKRIQPPGHPGDYLMDMGNAGYRQACMQHAVGLAKSKGFNGLFFDDVDAWYSWLVPSGATIPEYPTVSSWQTAMYGWITYAAANAQSLPAIVNIGGSTITSGLWQKWTAPFAGSEEESWTDGGMGTAQQISFWKAKLSNAVWSAAHNKITLLHSYNTTEAGNRYGLASMMLAENGYASYSVANANYTTDEEWYPEYPTAKALGSPTAAYTILSNGVYKRRFQNGIVLVNPTSKSIGTFSLGGGTYSGSGASNVSSVSMGATSGYILLSNHTSAPVNTSRPTISGSAVQGQTLTGSTGTWSGNPLPSYSYQWKRCTSTTISSCTAISGANAHTYKVQPADVGHYLVLTVSATNSLGSSKASSAPTAKVPTPTFTLSASPTSKTVLPGQVASYTITVTPKYGFTSSVALSASGLPPGATASFSPASTRSSSTLSISTSITSAGTSTITVSGTGGGQSKTTKITLTVA